MTRISITFREQEGTNILESRVIFLTSVLYLLYSRFHMLTLISRKFLKPVNLSWKQCKKILLH